MIGARRVLWERRVVKGRRDLWPGPVVEIPKLPRAACRSVPGDLWYASCGPSYEAAVAMCLECPEQAPCLAWALATGEAHGVWGGLATKERRRLARRMRETP